MSGLGQIRAYVSKTGPSWIYLGLARPAHEHPYHCLSATLTGWVIGLTHRTQISLLVRPGLGGLDHRFHSKGYAFGNQIHIQQLHGYTYSLFGKFEYHSAIFSSIVLLFQLFELHISQYCVYVGPMVSPGLGILQHCG